MSQYHIYQTDADYRFMGWNSVRDRFSLDDYTKVYSGELVDSVSYGSKTVPCNENDMEVLESLFQTFNVDIPKCYHARSLSVGDVVMISRKDGSRYYYCDNVGWRLIMKPFIFRNQKVGYDCSWSDEDTFGFDFGDGEFVDSEGNGYFIRFEYHVSDDEWIVEVWWENDFVNINNLSLSDADEYITVQEIQEVKNFAAEIFKCCYYCMEN